MRADGRLASARVQARPTLVLADSDARRRRGTATVLRLGGYRVVEVAVLGELREALADSPDALVSVADLSDGDAVAYLDRMRAAGGIGRSRVVFLCDSAPRTAAVAAAVGPGAALQLPVRPSTLLGALAAQSQ